jgi:hypothetical protein
LGLLPFREVAGTTSLRPFRLESQDRASVLGYLPRVGGEGSAVEPVIEDVTDDPRGEAEVLDEGAALDVMVSVESSDEVDDVPGNPAGLARRLVLFAEH